MATPNYARFLVNASVPDDKKFEATNGQSLTLSLETPGPALSVTYSAYDPADPSSPLATAGAAAFLFSNAARSIVKSPAATAETFNAPSIGAAGSAWIIRASAVIPGGVHIFERKIYVRNGRVGLVIPGETTQGGPRGWADEVSAAAGTPPDLVVAETLAIQGTLTPAAIAATQNDYNPAGLADATYLRLSTTSASRIGLTGLAGGSSGRIAIIENIGSTFSLVLFPESASSTAANRFSPVGPAGDFDVTPGEVVILRWESAISRWKILGTRSSVLGRFAFTSGLTGNTNNFSRFNASHVRIDPDLSGPWKITGISAGTERELLTISNIDATGASFRISSEDAGSTAANRFLLTIPELIIRNGESLQFIYDAVISRWTLSTQGVGGYPGDIQSAALNADQNDFTFSALLSTSSVLRVTPDANGRRITGIAATGVGLGRELILVNVSTTATFILQNESSSSSAANRLALPLDQFFVPPNGSCRLIYDTLSSRWRPAFTDAGPVFTRGANLTDANQTLQVSGGVDYQLPFGTLTASRDKTLGNTAPGTGTVITIRRFDRQAFTCVIKNHDGTVLFTFASAQPGEADHRFDGTNWVFSGFKPYP